MVSIGRHQPAAAFPEAPSRLNISGIVNLKGNYRFLFVLAMFFIDVVKT
jgi:hypothetical protein